MEKIKKIITYLIAINLFLLLFILINKVSFIRTTINTIIVVIVAPIVFGVFLFYLLRPIRNFIIKFNISKNTASRITMIILFSILILVGRYYGEYFINQIFEIKRIVLNFIEEYQVNNMFMRKLNEGINISNATGITTNLGVVISKGKMYFSNVITIFSGVMLSILILYFLLRDGERLIEKVLSKVDEKERVKDVFKKCDKKLSTYILGQCAVAFSLSIMMYIGYRVIGIGSGLLLASITFILAFIPFIGFFISLIVPYFIAFFMGWTMIMKLTILVIIAQTLKGRVVVPFVMGRVMKIHPLTDIVLVVLAATIGGPLLAFIIIPCYAIVKVIYEEEIFSLDILNKFYKRNI